MTASVTLDDIAAACGFPPRRYDIVTAANGETRYGPWHIYYEPPPIPSRNCDWHFYHDDFDGAPDAGDNRCGHAPSFAAALNECDEMEDEA